MCNSLRAAAVDPHRKTESLPSPVWEVPGSYRCQGTCVFTFWYVRSVNPNAPKVLAQYAPPSLLFCFSNNNLRPPYEWEYMSKSQVVRSSVPGKMTVLHVGTSVLTCSTVTAKLCRTAVIACTMLVELIVLYFQYMNCHLYLRSKTTITTTTIRLWQ